MQYLEQDPLLVQTTIQLQYPEQGPFPVQTTMKLQYLEQDPFLVQTTIKFSVGVGINFSKLSFFWKCRRIRLKLVIFLFYDLPACNKKTEILLLATVLIDQLRSQFMFLLYKFLCHGLKHYKNIPQNDIFATKRKIFEPCKGSIADSRTQPSN